MSTLNNLTKTAKALYSVATAGQEAMEYTTKDFKSRAPGWVGNSVTSVYNVKKSRVKEDYKGVIRVNASNKYTDIGYGLKYSGKLMTLGSFSPHPKRPPTKKQKIARRVRTKDGYRSIRPKVPYQISVEIEKGKRKSLIPSNNNYIFLALMNKKDYLPATRDKDSKKIRILKTISVPQMISNPKVQKEFHKEADTNLSKRYDHHIQRELSKIPGKIEEVVNMI